MQDVVVKYYMRKIFLIILTCCAVTGLQAQVLKEAETPLDTLAKIPADTLAWKPEEPSMEHLKFMGIPLDGPVSVFQRRLEKKGVKFDINLPTEQDIGSKAYVGTFSGEQAAIYVYYHVQDSCVFRAKAVIECKSEALGSSKFAKFRNLLAMKYKNEISSVGQQDGFPTYTVEVSYSDSADIMGSIDIYITTPSYYVSEMYVHIDYTDFMNYPEEESEFNLDDL